MIYVDAIQHYPQCRLRYQDWCHMATDSDPSALHRMAARLGLRRAWCRGQAGSSPLRPDAHQTRPGDQVWRAGGEPARTLAALLPTDARPWAAAMPDTERKGSMNNKQHPDLFAKKPTDLMNEMTDQQVSDRYTKELLKLKTLNQFGRHSARFPGYPNTRIMNHCRRELKRRGLPIPAVNPPGGTQAQQEGREPAGNESCS
jgi:hypothetical protein